MLIKVVCFVYKLFKFKLSVLFNDACLKSLDGLIKTYKIKIRDWLIINWPVSYNHATIPTNCISCPVVLNQVCIRMIFTIHSTRHFFWWKIYNSIELFLLMCYEALVFYYSVFQYMSMLTYIAFSYRYCINMVKLLRARAPWTQWEICNFIR